MLYIKTSTGGSGGLPETPLAINHGGTNASSASAARTSLGVAAATHAHAQTDVTGLDTALGGKAASSHSHSIDNVTSLQTALDGKSATGHNHAASDIASGTIDVSRIPVLPSQIQITSSGAISDLTSEQQAQIGQGTVVTTSDGFRWVYTGTGSKTSEASYIILADITPEWTAVSGKPSFATVATSGSYSDLSNKPSIPDVPTAIVSWLATLDTSDPANGDWWINNGVLTKSSGSSSPGPFTMSNMSGIASDTVLSNQGQIGQSDRGNSSTPYDVNLSFKDGNGTDHTSAFPLATGSTVRIYGTLADTTPIDITITVDATYNNPSGGEWMTVGGNGTTSVPDLNGGSFSVDVTPA